MQIIETHRKKHKPVVKEEVERKIKEIRKQSEKLVKGRFEFVDAQGGWIEFFMRILPDEPITTIRLVHGETCELPLTIIKHINNTVKKVRKISPVMTESVRGVPSSYEISSRIRFVPLEMI